MSIRAKFTPGGRLRTESSETCTKATNPVRCSGKIGRTYHCSGKCSCACYRQPGLHACSGAFGHDDCVVWAQILSHLPCMPTVLT